MSVSAAPLSVQQISALQNRHTYDDSFFWLYTKSNPGKSETIDNLDDDNDFVAILETCQNLGIDLLPITWQPALENLGVGGQAEIHQSLITAALSFAFGRIKPNVPNREAERTAYQVLRSQLLVLGKPTIRKHPHVISLIGVCWDIQLRSDHISASGDDTGNLETRGKEVRELESAHPCKWTIWPVLVYEKTKQGDLSCFLKSSAAQELDMKQKLKFCKDIAAGIHELHKNRIVHRDVKPQNILIFENIPGEYVAKVSDLGYSVQLKDEDMTVRLPSSKPWNAPEWHHRGWRFPDIVKMDLYSYGMVCLWMLFNQECLDTGFCFDIPAPSTYHDLEFLKSEDRLLSLATDLAEHSSGLSKEELELLNNIFKGCLVRDPTARACNVDEIFHGYLTGSNRSIDFVDGVIDNEFETETSDPFSIARTIIDYYEADFRVRQCVTSCLVQRFCKYRCFQDPENAKVRNVVLQLLVSSRLRFGTECNYLNMEELSVEYNISKNLVLAEFEKIRSTPQTVHHSVLQGLYDNGYIESIDFGQFYNEHDILDEAKSQLKAEVSSLASELSDSAVVVQILKGQLVDILMFEADWIEAEVLQKQIIGCFKEELGDTHRTTLGELHQLVLLYGDQNRWGEAEQLQIEILGTQKEVLAKNHPAILHSMESLASIYHEQGRSEDAEPIQIEVLQIEQEVFGKDHRRTLMAMDSLTTTNWGLGKHEEALQLHLQVLDTAKRVLGDEHPETMEYEESLAGALRDRDSLEEAEDIELRLLEMRKRVLGHEHYSTIRSMENLAILYDNKGMKGRSEEGERLKVQVLQVRKRTLGEGHEDTIRAMHELADFYCGQGRLNEDEKLTRESVEILRRTQGNEDLKTLGCMMRLASIYRTQKRWGEAQQLFFMLFEAYKRISGEEDWETIICMHNIAKTYYGQQLWDQSEYWELRAIEVSERALHGEKSATLAIQLFLSFSVSFTKSLVLTYKQKGDSGKAIRLLEDFKSKQLVYLGPDNAKKKDTAADLEKWAQEILGTQQY